jgi:hypothetical protein
VGGNAIATVAGDEPTVYSNPATDRLYVKSNAAKLDIRIYSIEGRCLYDKRFNSNAVDIPLSEIKITSGVYIVKVNGFTRKLFR